MSPVHLLHPPWNCETLFFLTRKVLFLVLTATSVSGRAQTGVGGRLDSDTDVFQPRGWRKLLGSGAWPGFESRGWSEASLLRLRGRYRPGGSPDIQVQIWIWIMTPLPKGLGRWLKALLNVQIFHRRLFSIPRGSETARESLSLAEEGSGCYLVLQSLGPMLPTRTSFPGDMWDQTALCYHCKGAFFH